MYVPVAFWSRHRYSFYRLSEHYAANETFSLSAADEVHVHLASDAPGNRFAARSQTGRSHFPALEPWNPDGEQLTANRQSPLLASVYSPPGFLWRSDPSAGNTDAGRGSGMLCP